MKLSLASQLSSGPNPDGSHKLFAIAFMKWHQGKEVLELRHAHAPELAVARFGFMASRPPNFSRLVGIAPAIGYHVDESDSNGEHLRCG